MSPCPPRAPGLDNDLGALARHDRRDRGDVGGPLLFGALLSGALLFGALLSGARLFDRLVFGASGARRSRNSVTASSMTSASSSLF
jgi:hypothetical protein